MAKVKFREGTSQAYNNTTPDEHTFYKVTHGTDSDNDEVYLGTVKIDNQITETNPSNDTSYYIPFVTDISSATHYTTGGNNGLLYTTMGGTTATPGKGTLELGNAISEGTSGNKTGSIKLYGATGDYYEISCPSFGPTETIQVELPTFTSSTTGGTGWLVGMAGNGNKGTASKPVYVDQYGIVNACDATVGGASTPVYMSSGTITACTSTIGSASRPVYMSAGVITSCSTMLSVSITGTASTASKLGTATVGGPSTPIYLSAGTATACTSTVGGAATPIYMSSGTMRACSSTVGGTSTPVYMSAGTISACTATVGTTSVPVFMSAGRFYSCSQLQTGSTLSGTVGGISTPVYLSNGTITALTGTVGNGSHPAFMSNGTVTACDSTVGTASIPVFMSNGTFYSCSTLGNRFVDWDTFNKYSQYAMYGTYGPYSVSENGYTGRSWTAINGDTINGTLCTYIGNRGFMDCSNLTTVSFPVCTWIESEAFLNCYKLSSVYLPECLGVGFAAFYSCWSLTSVELPQCELIGYSGHVMKYSGNAFTCCSALTTASFPMASYFGEGTFASDTAFKSLYLMGSSVAEADGDLFTNTSFSVSGKIYVPSSLYSSYRTADNWSEYAACFVSV